MSSSQFTMSSGIRLIASRATCRSRPISPAGTISSPIPIALILQGCVSRSWLLFIQVGLRKLKLSGRSRFQSSSTRSVLSNRSRLPSPSSSHHISIISRPPHSSLRQNSSSSTTPAAASSPSSASNPPRSIIARIQSTFALSNKASDTGGSSIRKLVQLARPEGKQLGIAVGLVSQPSSWYRDDEGEIRQLDREPAESGKSYRSGRDRRGEGQSGQIEMTWRDRCCRWRASISYILGTSG